MKGLRRGCRSVIIMLCAELDTTKNTHNLGFVGLIDSGRSSFM
jgi:hypothetical protein